MQKYSMALSPTLAAGVVTVAYNNRFAPISVLELTISHLRLIREISIRAVRSRTPGTPTTAMMILKTTLVSFQGIEDGGKTAY